MVSIVVNAMVEDWIQAMQSSSPMIVGLLGLGSIVGLALTIKILTSFYKTFVRPSKNLLSLGKWAIVTGATDGIGKAYAMALAKKGMSVLLISRTEEKLQQVQQEILQKGYKTKNGALVQVKFVVCDYSNFDNDAVRTTVQKAIAELDDHVGVLINNVGVSYRYPRFFHELTDTEVTQLLTMNIDSTVWMTRMVLPRMLQNKKGAIVNISSGSALYTTPLLAEYAGAKSFVEKFSRALNAEYRSKGITCQCQTPFYVATKLAKMRKSLTVPTATEYVQQAIKWVGYPDALVQPFYLHAIQGWIMHQIPDFLLAQGIYSMHMAIRSKGLKKDARQEQEESSNNKAKKN
jgi:17beta-estradiol 17-dehydrogenase / very-long-chain 3-oxoacyl-CoA reductase